MKQNVNIKIIQETIDKLNIAFEKAIKDGDFLQSQKIDLLIGLLEDAKQRFLKGRKK